MIKTVRTFGWSHIVKEGQCWIHIKYSSILTLPPLKYFLYVTALPPDVLYRAKITIVSFSVVIIISRRSDICLIV